MKALSGVKVLDLTRALARPLLYSDAGGLWGRRYKN